MGEIGNFMNWCVKRSKTIISPRGRGLGEKAEVTARFAQDAKDAKKNYYLSLRDCSEYRKAEFFLNAVRREFF